jgi:hypothetical protein
MKGVGYVMEDMRKPVPIITPRKMLLPQQYKEATERKNKCLN